MLEHLCQFFKTRKKFFLRVFLIPPQPISIMMSATPLGFASVVIEEDHDPFFGEVGYCLFENLYRGHAVEERV
jgi:hypothetical protein